MDTLNGLLDRAEAQLDDARKTETADLHNYQMLKQSLVDEVKYANKEMVESKAAIVESGEKKAIAEGNLQATTKELNSRSSQNLRSCHTNVLSSSQEGSR